MKKVILSLSLLVASLAANAQFVIWDVNAGTGFEGAGSAYAFTPGANSFTVDTANAAPFYIDLSGVAANNCGPSNNTGCYYINGFGNGSYAMNGDKQAFGYSAANFATDKFFMDVKTTGVKLKVQFSTFTAGVQDADMYGYEFDLSANSATAYTTVSLLMSSFSKIVSDNPNNTDFLTSAIAARIGKIEFAFVKVADGGAGAASASIGYMSIGSAQLTPPEINVKNGATSVADGGSVAFASVVSGNSGTAQTFTIENTGTTALHVTSIGISGSEFTLGGLPTFPASVAAGGTQTFTVTFSPTTVGTGKTATVTIASDDANEASYELVLTGDATATATPEINVKLGATSIATAGTATLPAVANGSTGTAQTFTIENNGSGALNISSITLGGSSDFTFAGTAGASTVAAGGTSTFTITFAPTTTGTITGTVTIASDDADEASYVINLSATGNAVSGTNAALANIASSKVYPNPVSDMANIELNLKSASDVKVTLSDMMGKTLMTVAEGTMSSLNKEVSVAGLNKGIYTVTYFINGAAAKAELLMVK